MQAEGRLASAAGMTRVNTLTLGAVAARLASASYVGVSVKTGLQRP